MASRTLPAASVGESGFRAVHAALPPVWIAAPTHGSHFRIPPIPPEALHPLRVSASLPQLPPPQFLHVRTRFLRSTWKCVFPHSSFLPSNVLPLRFDWTGSRSPPVTMG